MKLAKSRRKAQIEVIYLESGKEKSILLNGTAEQINFWKRQRNGEVSVIEARRVA